MPVSNTDVAEIFEEIGDWLEAEDAKSTRTLTPLRRLLKRTI